ncbi:hypothetical protein OROGR_024980 [Orobanche gracilis]
MDNLRINTGSPRLALVMIFDWGTWSPRVVRSNLYRCTNSDFEVNQNF